ncbi:MAG: GAF domain-containing protein [Pseudomonadota bacterium]
MTAETFEAIQDDLIAKSDTLARELTVKMNCDCVFISLANTNNLFSLGASVLDPTDVEERVQLASDTVCAITAARNEPLTLDDARTVKEMLKRPFVAEGKVVGYLGKPLRDENAESVGAICAVTTATRLWSEMDHVILQNAAGQVEKMLTEAGFRHSHLCLSNALGEYDDMMGAIAMYAEAKISVHGASGELLFATNALLQDVEPCVLEDHMRRTHNQHGLDETAALRVPNKKAPCQNTQRLRPRVRSHSEHITFVQWDPVEASAT